jgi:hypothetical protein
MISALVAPLSLNSAGHAGHTGAETQRTDGGCSAQERGGLVGTRRDARLCPRSCRDWHLNRWLACAAAEHHTLTLRRMRTPRPEHRRPPPRTVHQRGVVHLPADAAHKGLVHGPSLLGVSHCCELWCVHSAWAGRQKQQQQQQTPVCELLAAAQSTQAALRCPGACAVSSHAQGRPPRPNCAGWRDRGGPSSCPAPQRKQCTAAAPACLLLPHHATCLCCLMMWRVKRSGGPGCVQEGVCCWRRWRVRAPGAAQRMEREPVVLMMCTQHAGTARISLYGALSRRAQPSCA